MDPAGLIQSSQCDSKQKDKTDDLEFETAQRKVRSTKEVKTGTNTNPAVIKGVKSPRSIVIYL